MLCFDVSGFFDDAVRFADQGQFSGGQQRWREKHYNARTHTLAHVHRVHGAHTHTLSCLPEHLCVWKREQHKASLSLFLSFFFIPQAWDDTLLFLRRSPPLCILIRASGGMGLLKFCVREAIRCWAGHHSAVKGILLMCCPSCTPTSAEYICVFLRGWGAVKIKHSKAKVLRKSVFYFY